MKVLLVLGLAVFCSFAAGEKCPEGSWRHKNVRLGIFYTEKYLKGWEKTKKIEGEVSLSKAVKNLARKLNSFFSKEHFNYSSVTFEAQDINVVMVQDSDVATFNRHRRSSMHVTARSFCHFAQRKKQESKQTWDFAFLLTDEELIQPYTTGAVAGVHAMCSAQSCAVLNTKSTVHGSSAEFSAYPRLLAYFLGLSFGLDFTRHFAIISAPESGKVRWSEQSKRDLNRFFQDKLEFRCLRWSCGAYDYSNEVFSRPHILKELNQLCQTVIPSMPGVLDEPKTNMEFQVLTTGRSRLRDYVTFLLENRFWYRLENMCKGAPCLFRRGRSMAAFELFQEDLEGKSCGDAMVCVKGVCARTEKEREEEEIKDNKSKVQKEENKDGHEEETTKEMVTEEMVSTEKMATEEPLFSLETTED